MRRVASRIWYGCALASSVALTSASCGRVGFADLGAGGAGDGAVSVDRDTGVTLSFDGGGRADIDASPLADGSLADGAMTMGCPSQPAWCSDLLFYLPFDGSFTDAFGDAPSNHDDVNVTLTAGFVGQAASINGALAYASAGNYDIDEGTLVFWMSPTWTMPCASTHMFFIGAFSSPYFACDSSQSVFGADAGLLSPVAAAVPDADLASYIDVDGWYHVATTWSQLATPTLSFALDADALGGSPTAASTDQTWSASQPATFGLGGQAGARPQARVDELAIIGRPLTPDELTCLYDAQRNSSQTIGQLCGP